MSDDSKLAAAFNAGSDARLSGRSFSDCPYTEHYERQYWRHGWQHVSMYWGREAKRWPVQKLPPIRGFFQTALDAAQVIG